MAAKKTTTKKVVTKKTYLKLKMVDLQELVLILFLTMVKLVEQMVYMVLMSLWILLDTAKVKKNSFLKVVYLVINQLLQKYQEKKFLLK